MDEKYVYYQKLKAARQMMFDLLRNGRLSASSVYRDELNAIEQAIFLAMPHEEITYVPADFEQEYRFKFETKVCLN